MLDVPIKEIMIAKVVSVKVDESFSHVEEKMRLNKIRHLPVVDGDNKLVGMITQRDLLRAMRPRETEDGPYFDPDELDEFILKHYMTPDPHALHVDDPISKAVKLMAEFKYGAIPIVTSDKTLVGIISEIDILKYMAKHL